MGEDKSDLNCPVPRKVICLWREWHLMGYVEEMCLWYHEHGCHTPVDVGLTVWWACFRKNDALVFVGDVGSCRTLNLSVASNRYCRK